MLGKRLLHALKAKIIHLNNLNTCESANWQNVELKESSKTGVQLF